MQQRPLLRVLAATWSQENAERFRGAMRPAVLVLTEGRVRLGQWERARRTIGISRVLVQTRPWPVVVEVLKHEMAHQYVDEVLGVVDETAHGPAFRRVCRQFGIDEAATGDPQVPPATGEEPRVLRKVRRLLALAGSDNRHEAEAAMNAAHRLMLTHNLDVAAMDEPGLDYGWRLLGAPRGRVPGHEKVLAGILARHFFVEAIWIHSWMADRGAWGRVLEVCGTAANLDIAAWVHAFVLDTGERLWTSHRRERGISGNKDRRRFLVGVMTGFHDTLVAQTEALEQTGLVWVGDPHLDDFVGLRHPRLRKARGSRVQVDGAFREGRSAGRGIVLQRPISQGPGGGEPGQLVDRRR